MIEVSFFTIEHFNKLLICFRVLIITKKGAYYNETEPLSAHLFTVDSDEWQKLRSKLTPSYTTSKLKFIFPTMIEMGKRFRDHLSEVTRQSNEVDIKDLCARFTTDVIGNQNSLSLSVHLPRNSK